MTAERLRIQTGIERLDSGEWRPLIRLTRPGQEPEELRGDACATEAIAERIARVTAAEIRVQFGAVPNRQTRRAERRRLGR